MHERPHLLQRLAAAALLGALRALRLLEPLGVPRQLAKQRLLLRLQHSGALRQAQQRLRRQRAGPGGWGDGTMLGSRAMQLAGLDRFVWSSKQFPGDASTPLPPHHGLPPSTHLAGGGAAVLRHGGTRVQLPRLLLRRLQLHSQR